jgi:hypothetical protein
LRESKSALSDFRKVERVRVRSFAVAKKLRELELTKNGPNCNKVGKLT